MIKKVMTGFAVVLFTMVAPATVVQVDFNTASSLAATNGGVWNVFATPSTATLNDTNGTATAYSMSFGAGWGVSTGTGNEGAFDGGNFDNAADDYFFNNSDGTYTITVSGFDPANVVHIQVIGSYGSSSTTLGDYKIDGNFRLPDLDGNQNGTFRRLNQLIDHA